MRKAPDELLTRLGPMIARDEAAVGLVIDTRYEVLRRIARGGMGEVFLAQDLRLGRPVAMKTLAPELSSERWAARFQAEARATAGLDHPGVVPIHDLGRFPDGRLYYTMKYVPGRTLAEAIRDGEGRGRLLSLLARAARVVEHAHQRGVIHRDLKPSNVMVGEKGEVYVLDWGVARVLGEFRHERAEGGAAGGGLTSAGSVLGTLEYMPPEQARGDAGQADARSDVFSLGAILFEILCGRPPVAGASTRELLAAAKDGARPSPRKLGGRISPDLEAICLRALAPEPAGRYASAGDLAGDLDRFRKRLPVAARPVPFPARAGRAILRHPARTAAALAVAVALGAGVAAWMVSGSSERKVAEGESRSRSEAEAHRLLEEGRPALDRAILYLYGKDASYEALVRRVEEGQAKIEEAIQVAPWLAVGPYLLGRAWELRGHDDRAEAAYREAIRLDPLLAPARYRLGRLLVTRAFLAGLAVTPEDQRARRPGAEDLAIEGARELDLSLASGSGLDDEKERHLASGMVAFAALDFAAAREAAAEGLRRFAGADALEEFHWLLGVSSMGRQAIESFDRAIGIRPCYPLAYFCRGVAREGLPDLPGAIEDYTAAIRLSPRFAQSFVNRGALRAATGDLDLAIADCDAALALDPGHVEAWSNRGIARTAKGEFEAALADLAEAIRLHPGFARAFTNRGIVKKMEGDLPGALADQAEAIRLDPRLPEAHAERGAVLAEQGDLEGALSAFRTALAVAPPGWIHRAAVEGAIEQLSGSRE